MQICLFVKRTAPGINNGGHSLGLLDAFSDALLLQASKGLSAWFIGTLKQWYLTDAFLSLYPVHTCADGSFL